MPIRKMLEFKSKKPLEEEHPIDSNLISLCNNNNQKLFTDPLNKDLKADIKFFGCFFLVDITQRPDFGEEPESREDLKIRLHMKSMRKIGEQKPKGICMTSDSTGREGEEVLNIKDGCDLSVSAYTADVCKDVRRREQEQSKHYPISNAISLECRKIENHVTRRRFKDRPACRKIYRDVLTNGLNEGEHLPNEMMMYEGYRVKKQPARISRRDIPKGTVPSLSRLAFEAVCKRDSPPENRQDQIYSAPGYLRP